MVVSSSTRLLDSLSRRSVPAWLTAQQSSLKPITQGILVWQATVEELLASVRHCHRQKATTKMTTKLWLGYGADSLGQSCWYGVGNVKVVARSQAGAALVNPRNAPPGTVLDIKSSGVTVAVRNGAVRLSNFITPLGRPLQPIQLPLAIGQRLPRLTPFQQRAIARLEAGISEHEQAWHQRLSRLRPLQLPYGNGEPGLGSIFARLPLELAPALARGNEEFQGYLAQLGGGVLLTVLTSYLMNLAQAQGERQAAAAAEPMLQPGEGGSTGKLAFRNKACSGDIGLRTSQLQQMLCSDELAALFASHVPARFGMNLGKSLAYNLEVVLEELQFLEKRLTHRQDLALEVNPTKLPSLYPVLIEVVNELSEAPHRLGQSLTIQVTESGEASAWFYNPAVLAEEEVAQMQAEFMNVLGAIAQIPNVPLSEHLELLGDPPKALV